MQIRSLFGFRNIWSKIIPGHAPQTQSRKKASGRKLARFCPAVEMLEDRTTPSLIATQILPLTVVPATTTNTVSVLAPALSPSSATPQQVTLTDIVSGAPTGGTVDFAVAGVGTVANVPVVNGVAQVVFTIPVGTPSSAGGTVTATYTGTAGFSGSTSSGSGNGTLTFCMDNASTLLGTTLQSFAVLAGSTVTNVGPTVIVGNVGVSPGSAVTGFPPGSLVAPSTIHINDGPAGLAQIELTTAYTTILNENVGFINLTGQDLGGLTLTPGRYHFDTSAQLTGILTLNDQNNPAARFDFQIGSTLTTASGSGILFINGGADNVYWQVGSSATLGSSTAFAGNILANASISLNSTASIACGRALARTGAVTLINNFIDPAPPDLTGPPAAALDMPTFTWSSVAGADHYYLWVTDTTTGNVVIQVLNANGTSWTPGAVQALTPGHAYTWWVAPVSAAGTRGLWSAGINLTVPALAIPVPISPNAAGATGAGFDTPTYTWGSVAGANHYYLWVNDTTTGQVTLQVRNAIGTTWMTGAGQALTPGHSYTWWVAAVSTNGTNSLWSSGKNFSVAALNAPTAINPVTTNSVPTFTWTPVAGAASYVIWVDDQTTGQSKALLIQNLQGTSYTISAAQALKPGHKYVWWVGAVSTNTLATEWSSSNNYVTAN